MSINFELSDLVIALLAVSLLCTLVVLLVYCRFVLKVARRKRECNKMIDENAADCDRWPMASVIVYSQALPEQLERFLPAVLEQDYPGAYEVIVVNEGDSGDVRNTIAALQLAHRNLYLTFTPDGVRNLSRKKLAVTLGVKAARGEVVVLTTVDAVIKSNQWLAKMMRHFKDPRTGIVLGYAAPGDSPAGRKASRSAMFDFAAENVDWLSAAIGHHAFRGTELNLAYRCNLFFANKGFYRTLNLHGGDDDIFISEIATKSNTVVELSDESIVRFESYDNAALMRDIAVRHLLSNQYIMHRPLSRLAVGQDAMWLGVVSSLAAVFVDWQNIVTVSVVALMFVLSAVFVAISWRKTTVALELRRLTLTAIWFAFVRPINRLMLKTYSHLSKQKKFTWD